MPHTTDILLKYAQEGQTEKLKEIVLNNDSNIVWSECIQMKSQDSCLHLAAREGHNETLRLVMKAHFQSNIDILILEPMYLTIMCICCKGSMI